jgi:20S proteasome subunit alpha 5|eukprot:Tamp_05599.p2 GENE.Tamp_05599~~Tamp_05599.p2  ORF type:complete len:217 (-),score=25.91 Tamp_05599:1590-2240(-)
MQNSNNFSSDGRLTQLEFASEAIKLGSIIIGIKTKFCVLLLLEKKKDELLNENIHGQKLINFNDSLGCVISGLTSDARFLIEQIQVRLENNFFVSNQATSVENCGKIILKLASFLEDEDEQTYFKNRPLGIAFLVCGLDSEGFGLFQIDPSGVLKKKEFASLGSGQDESTFMIRESYRKNMSPNEALNLGKKILKILTEKKLDFDQQEFCLIKKKF